jgi:hypothetical protein
MSWVKKYKQDLLIVSAAILTVVVGVMGWHWTDVANTPFWWNFWLVAAIAADALCIIVWAIGFFKKPKR